MLDEDSFKKQNSSVAQLVIEKVLGKAVCPDLFDIE